MGQVEAWLAALDERHLANLTPPEVARALRALSSCYVERRGTLERGGALDSGGKRAAFALFYAPIHFLVTREIVRSLPRASDRVARLVDLGCGTGSAGAAWALEAHAAHIMGFDRHPWAVAEANWTYRQFALNGRAAQNDVAHAAVRGAAHAAILAAYTINELPDRVREGLLPKLVSAHAAGARVLIVEPIARRIAGWWSRWRDAVLAAGGRADEWRFRLELPSRQRALAKAAGLDPRELTARSLFLGLHSS